MERVGGGRYRLEMVLEVCGEWGVWSGMARIGVGLLIELGLVLGVGDSLDLRYQKTTSNLKWDLRCAYGGPRGINPLLSVESIIRVIELICRSFCFTEVSICSNSSIIITNRGEISVQEGDGEDKDEPD